MVPFSGFVARGFPGQGESGIYQGGGAQTPRRTFTMSSEGTPIPSDLSSGQAPGRASTWALDVFLWSGNHSSGD